MPATLRIQLLDEFHLFIDGQSFEGIKKPRQQALLAYLLLHRHVPLSRQQLAFTFWPDSTESQAHTNLRKLIFQVRQALPEADCFLTIDSVSLGWRKEASFTLDVAEVEMALTQLETEALLAPKTVERVIALYQGELLPTCYEDWLFPIRRSLCERVVEGLEKAIWRLEAQHEYRVALCTAQHLLRLDPLQEATYRHLMHLRALSGDRAGALRVYHECVTMLERELEVSPTSATQALYQQLLNLEPQTIPSPKMAPSQACYVPLVGRTKEWQQVQQAWQQMAYRGPHMLTVWGEAGVGKTRLVEELVQWARARSGSVFYARSYAAESAFSYGPSTQWLRSAALYKEVQRLDEIWQTELSRLLPELLAQQPSLPPPSPMSEGWQRRRLHEAMARAIMTAPPPLLLIVDDLQWCDTETLAWLSYLLHFDSQSPLLVIGTVRSEVIDDEHPLHILRQQLQREAQWTELELAPLTIEETKELVGHLTGGNQTDSAMQLYQETEGNPLFVVEMIRAGFAINQSDGPESPANLLPPTVQAVIGARLSKLSPAARELAQVAATIGRAFAVDVLAAASALSEDALVQGIDELWRRRIVREQGEEYDFSHDKIREVAYGESSLIRKRLLHRRVAQALETCYAGRLDSIVGQLAMHYQEGGAPEQAILYYQKAAEASFRLSALVETERFLSKGLTLFSSLPASTSHALRELQMQLMLGAALKFTQPAQSGKALRRALELCYQLNQLEQVPDILNGLRRFHYMRAEHQTALAFSQQLLEIAEQRGDPALLVSAHSSVGIVLKEIGEFSQAHLHFEKMCAYHDPEQHHKLALRFGQDPYLDGLTYFAYTLWVLGYPDQAYARCKEAVVVARERGYAVSLIAILARSASYLCYLGSDDEAERQLEEAIQKATELGLILWVAWASALLGRLKSSQGKVKDAIPLLEYALTAFGSTEEKNGLEIWMVCLAKDYAQSGKSEEAWVAARQAISMAQENKSHTLPEVYRIVGEILLAEAKMEQAESYFIKALSIARYQQAKSFELRIAISLSRLWRQQGNHARAQELLSGIYGWFTEGFGTRDLLEAKALLS